MIEQGPFVALFGGTVWWHCIYCGSILILGRAQNFAQAEKSFLEAIELELKTLTIPVRRPYFTWNAVNSSKR